MKNIILLLIFLVSADYCYPQKTNYKIDYYSPRDYGKGFEATNYACVQDINGILYFGNAGGVVQYDGAQWSFIPVRNQSVWIEALAISNENILYTGAQNEFGYFAPDASGKLVYISLSDKLDDKRNPFLKIVHVWAWNNIVVFQYEEAVFVYSQGKITTILPETSFHVSFLIDNEFFVRQRELGIMKLTGNSLELVNGSEYLKDFGIFSIIESADSSGYTIITNEDGLWSVDKATFKGSKMDLDDDMIFKQSGIYGAIKLSDGNIALNTLWNGIIITDERFNILSVINKDSGLKVNGVLSLMQDYQGNLWAGLDNGIVQVHYSSPVSQFGPESGITGNIRAIERFEENLFIGTTDGLFFHNINSKTLSEAFTKYGGLSKEIRSMCIAGNLLMIGTMDELYEITGNKINLIEKTEIYSLHYSQKLKILFISSKRGFSLYKYSGKWEKQKNIPEITEEVVRFEESVSNDTLTLWMGTSIQGIVRLHLFEDLDYEVSKYNSDDGLPASSWVLPFKIDDDVVFSQRNGLLSFVSEETIRAQLPDSLRNRPEFFKGYFDIYDNECFKEQNSQPFYLIKDTRARVYVYLDGEAVYYDKNDSCSMVKEPFCLTDIGRINVFHHENTGFCWIGGDDGLVMFDETYSKNYNSDFKTLITRVSCGGKDSVLWHGNVDKRILDNSDQLIRKKVILPYKLNTLNFTYAAPFFEGEDKILFSFMLSGQDTLHSSWDKENRIVLRNLREGEYVFTVRAMNAYGHISSDASFGFRIMPPWYRTIWAVITYIILFILTVYTAIRLYTRRLIALNKRLENTVKERTHEIHVKNTELESQKKEIVDSINYAQRIQNAILPNEELMKAYLGDHFVIFRPKDIVSGDFYWAKTLNQHTVFCVADCTGHGVPGAFMSMLCISLLNEVLIKDRIVHPEVVLDKIRKMVIESLKQTGAIFEQKDGMDISICFYNRETSVIEFAGANSPVYIVRGSDLEPLPYPKQMEDEKHALYEIKGDRMPVSFSDRMDPFIRHTVRIEKDDRIYLFSDGIGDQSGGPAGKRFMKKCFKAAIFETISPDIKDQRSAIENRIDEWQAHINPLTGHGYEQVDDICLMGIKL